MFEYENHMLCVSGPGRFPFYLYLPTRVKCRRTAAHALLAGFEVFRYIHSSRAVAVEYAEMSVLI